MQASKLQTSLFTLAVVMPVLLAATTTAATWQVAKDGSGDFTVIQDAVDVASPGDVIMVGPGRYEEFQVWNDGVHDWHIYVLIETDDLTIIGSGPDETIIGPVDNSVNGEYTKTDHLPEQSSEVSVVTDIWFKIEGVPAKYDKMLLQVDLYRQTDSGWSEFRVATSDRPVFGKGNLWQHSLSLTAPRGSQWADEIRSEQLPPGRYLVKLYIDQAGKLQEDFAAELGENEFVGRVEFESRWPVGYGRMTVVKFPVK